MNRRITLHLRLAAAAAALAASAVLAVPAHAQDSQAGDPQFAALSSRLRAGDVLTITDTDGAVVKGRLVDVSPQGITVRQGEERRTIDRRRVERVRRTRIGVLLGAIIGGGAGIASGAALASLFGNEGGYRARAFLGPLAIGLGAGIAVDALVNLPRTVYTRRPGARVSVSPVLTADTRGALVGISF